MAEKYPDIQTTSDQPLGDDLLAREKELLGDDAQQFVTGEENDAFGEEEEDEVKQFEEQFPDVHAQDHHQQQQQIEAEQNEEIEREIQGLSVSGGNSQAIKEWEERFNLEIQKRDEADAKITSNIREEAEKQLDDFYESYNIKKEENIKKAKEAEADFIEKRDSFFSEGNVWKRSAQLIKESGVENKRFREVLDSKVRSIQD